jgi:hypothetical protein
MAERLQRAALLAARARRAGVVLGCGALLSALALEPAHQAQAHGGGAARVRAVVDAEQPAALAGMRFESHHTVAPQLVVANPTGRVLEVLDDHDVAFVRIGPDGVAANVAAPAWFLTAGPGAPVPASLRDGADAPRWVAASRERSFGWFEPRLDATTTDVPDAVREGGRAADVGRWQVPLRVDGVQVALRGHFRFEPPARPRRVRLTSPSAPATGVRVRLLPGATPGLLVENVGRNPLTVLDAAGEPFLRVSRKGVEANVRSRAWLDSARASAAADHGPAFRGAASWQRVTRAPRYVWIDRRVLTGEDGTRSAWQVPMLLGTTALTVSGVTDGARVLEVAQNSPR